jgi:charged multivesicular body protein 3
MTLMTLVGHVLQRQAVAEGVDDDDEEDLEEIRARLAKVRS